MRGEYISVLSVAPLKDYRLAVSLSNGKKGVFDVKPLLARPGLFRALRDRRYFSQVRTFFTGVGWPNGVDISPFAIDYKLQPFKNGESLRPIASPEEKTMRRRIARFGGIQVLMPYPQPPKRKPRIVVRCAKGEAEIAVESGRRLRGNLPPEKSALLNSWLKERRKDLIANGLAVQSGKAPSAVAPLR